MKRGDYFLLDERERYINPQTFATINFEHIKKALTLNYNLNIPSTLKSLPDFVSIEFDRAASNPKINEGKTKEAVNTAKEKVNGVILVSQWKNVTLNIKKTQL
ncbi:MAG: hypothetical protein LE169_04930 [Endomicrobium sp.]|nr:hypothetical protein [Endomicrobium sp.]